MSNTIVQINKALNDTYAFMRSIAHSGKRLSVSAITRYNSMFRGASCAEYRKRDYAQLVATYYDLATDFYKWGWGNSFHFANCSSGETFAQSLIRHERMLVGKMRLSRKDMHILDCGCGIAGPAVNIANMQPGAKITGITINEYQVAQGNELCKQHNLHDRIEIVHGDFMNLPFKPNTFDGVYAIESTCHAPSRLKVYSEVFKVLKPGSIFACYEWCLTDVFDKDNLQHKNIKHAIEEGNGLPELCHYSECVSALKESGFVMIENGDADLYSNLKGSSWYHLLTPSWSPLEWPRFQFNSVMMLVMPSLLRVLECIYIVPHGTCDTQRMLQKAAIGCAKGGETGIFTPMWLFVVQKPHLS